MISRQHLKGIVATWLTNGMQPLSPYSGDLSNEFEYDHDESARELAEHGFVEIIPSDYSSITCKPTTKGIFEALS